jgi:hypothetical protein
MKLRFQKGQHHLRRQGSKARLSDPVDDDGDSFAITSSLPVVIVRTAPAVFDGGSGVWPGLPSKDACAETNPRRT